MVAEHTQDAAVLRFMGMKQFPPEAGKIGWLLLWLIGIPVPILIIFFLVRGCT
jgi:hypothetical protein